MGARRSRRGAPAIVEKEEYVEDEVFEIPSSSGDEEADEDFEVVEKPKVKAKGKAIGKGKGKGKGKAGSSASARPVRGVRIAAPASAGKKKETRVSAAKAKAMEVKRSVRGTRASRVNSSVINIIESDSEEGGDAEANAAVRQAERDFITRRGRRKDKVQARVEKKEKRRAAAVAEREEDEDDEEAEEERGADSDDSEEVDVQGESEMRAALESVSENDEDDGEGAEEDDDFEMQPARKLKAKAAEGRTLRSRTAPSRSGATKRSKSDQDLERIAERRKKQRTKSMSSSGSDEQEGEEQSEEGVVSESSGEEEESDESDAGEVLDNVSDDEEEEVVRRRPVRGKQSKSPANGKRKSPRHRKHTAARTRTARRESVAEPAPERALTKEERRLRLEELVEQSAAISRGLNAALENVGGGENAADAVVAADEDGVTEVAVSAGKSPDELLAALPFAPGHALKPYQEEGIKWLLQMDKNGYNGILADEMGLGKTISGLSALASFIFNDKRGPHLIIAPMAVVHQWKAEADRWFPGVLKIYVHSGHAEERLSALEDALNADDWDIMIMSHDLALRDLFGPLGSSWGSGGAYRGAVRRLRRVEFEYMVVDEAHRLKNPNSKLNQHLRRYKRAGRRILLTGTPLSNNLDELFALLNVLNPTIFGNVETFRSWFASPFDDGVKLDNTEKSMIVSRMHTVLRPFFRRRTRADVVSTIGTAAEVIIACPPTPLQSDLQRYYRILRMWNQSPKGMLWSLRKTANHPSTLSQAFMPPEGESIDSRVLKLSGKMIFLHYALPRLLAAQHRILIFCQSLDMLDLLKDMLDFSGINFASLDGRVSGEERPEILADFNSESPSCSVFLLSTRAGGVGLNLQSADTVILCESDWNPMADLQAVSRVQRIGQTKTVHVMRLVTRGQVDEVIVRVARKKLKTEAVAVGAGNFATGKEGETTIRQKDVEELLDALDDVQPEVDEIDMVGTSLVQAETEAPPVAAIHDTVPRSDEKTAEGAFAFSGIGGSECKALGHAPTSGAVVSGVSTADVAMASTDLENVEESEDKSVKVCPIMAPFVEEWDKLLIRKGGLPLPDLSRSHPVLSMPSRIATVPEWLRCGSEGYSHVGVALEASSPEEAEDAVRMSKEDAAFLTGQNGATRQNRRTRVKHSMAEFYSSDSSDGSDSGDGSGSGSGTPKVGSRHREHAAAVDEKESDGYSPTKDASDSSSFGEMTPARALSLGSPSKTGEVTGGGANSGAIDLNSDGDERVDSFRPAADLLQRMRRELVEKKAAGSRNLAVSPLLIKSPNVLNGMQVAGGASSRLSDAVSRQVDQAPKGKAGMAHSPSSSGEQSSAAFFDARGSDSPVVPISSGTKFPQMDAYLLPSESKQSNGATVALSKKRSSGGVSSEQGSPSSKRSRDSF